MPRQEQNTAPTLNDLPSRFDDEDMPAFGTIFYVFPMSKNADQRTNALHRRLHLLQNKLGGLFGAFNTMESEAKQRARDSERMLSEIHRDYLKLEDRLWQRVEALEAKVKLPKTNRRPVAELIRDYELKIRQARR